MPGFFLRLNDDALRALIDLAVEERRDIRDQAALLLERTLLPREARVSITKAPRLVGAQRAAAPA